MLYIVILNWNGWRDTLECLESLFRLDRQDFRVVVCDNGSSDRSVEHICEWANGTLPAVSPTNHPLARSSFPPVEKPIAYRLFDRPPLDSDAISCSKLPRLVLIRTGGNLGFAGGNNVGLRFALQCGNLNHAWLLNNDTVVAPDSLDKLSEMLDRLGSDSRVGIVGTKLLFYDSAETIQAIGGQYGKRLGISSHLGFGEVDVGQYDDEAIAQRFSYVVGASMIVSRAFLDDVGLMCEDYFLYFEELDWAIRAKQKGWRLGYCPGAKVYHKEGRSIGSHKSAAARSALSDYYITRNKVQITRKFFPECLWSVKLGLVGVALNRIRRGQFRRVGFVLRTLFS
jgi:GT2 family glycosyltransferase